MFDDLNTQKTDPDNQKGDSGQQAVSSNEPRHSTASALHPQKDEQKQGSDSQNSPPRPVRDGQASASVDNRDEGIRIGPATGQKAETGAAQAGTAPAGPLPHPQASPQGIEDIFAKTDKVEKPDVFQPKKEDPVNISEPDKDKELMIKKMVLLVTVLVSILIFFGLAFWAYGFLVDKLGGTNAAPEAAPDLSVDIDNNISPTGRDQGAGALDAGEERQPSYRNQAADSQKPLDSDQDGLTDEEEMRLGTSPNNRDTDSDGLFDREEARVYNTDPLDPDTDRDGYIDGDEVKEGYNPNGSGKLYEIN